MIDTPHTAGAALTAGREADLIIIPCHPATADLHAMGTTIDIARIAQKPMIVVSNRALVNHPANEEARKTIRSYGAQSCPVILHQRIDHQHAFTEGLAATELAPEGKAAGELRELERWIRSVQAQGPKAERRAEHRCRPKATGHQPAERARPGRQRHGHDDTTGQIGCKLSGGYSDRRIYARDGEHRTAGRAYLRAEPGRPPANARELDDNETAGAE